jgi:hypothetical protein
LINFDHSAAGKTTGTLRVVSGYFHSQSSQSIFNFCIFNGKDDAVMLKKHCSGMDFSEKTYTKYGRSVKVNNFNI